MRTYKVYIDGFCVTVDLTEQERAALEADGATVQEGR